MAEETQEPKQHKPPYTIQRLRGALAGTVTIPDGVDLTEPACPEWADMIEAGESPTVGDY